MDEMISEVLSKYGIQPIQSTLIKQETDRCVWKISGGKGTYALKQLELSRAKKFVGVVLHLLDYRVPVIPVLPTLKGDYVVETGKLGLLLFPWFEGEQIRYETPGAIEGISELLAKYHEALKGFKPSGIKLGQIGLDLLKDYSKGLEMLKIRYKEYGSSEEPFAKAFCNHYPWFLKRAKWVIHKLPNTSYHKLVKTAKRDHLIGHGDYSRSNILCNDKGEWRIIDLDSAHISLPVRDLSRMITWMNHDLRSWDYARFKTILQCYRSIRPFSEEEEKLLIIDQCFPHQALTLVKRYQNKHNMNTLLEELESLVVSDKEKIRDLSIKELE